ncbi:chymotrypsin-2-like isoform X1 [Trichoplusia ni]|uniref:Chymotrypsin-2-like isoform X1 n=2 Tax=Trichoplusia ni TaxID=7111 RepID=A0A7E5WM60_TRINI|nr:chymotrypsin-2-like isoform X1 [Trichoplusia ni]
MGFKTGLVLGALLAGCFALPKPEEDLSKYFDPRDTRIVGGSEAAEGSHPHMVALHKGLLVSSYFCGGSVVGRRSILTAAHCIGAGSVVPGILLPSLRATVGTNRWHIGGQTYRLSHDITHPEYDFLHIRNDIGLLITDTDIQFSDRVKPVPLSVVFTPGGEKAKLAGWGRVIVGGPIPPTLLELDTTIVDGDTCVQLAAEAVPNFPDFSFPDVEPEIHICALNSVGHGGCNGDSGSALVRVETGEQIGIVSWGFPCATGDPDVFVRVSAYQDFLSANLV